MQNNSIAKVNSPVVDNVLFRERLFQTLDHARKKKAVWITGLPGSGKTTLAASYLSAKKLPHSWYHVDSSDADLATFFYYLRYVIKKITPVKSSKLPLLTPEYLANIETYTHRFFEILFSMLPEGFVLVFDNYHEINGNPVFHNVVNEALKRVPEHGNVIVISRTEPPAAFSSLKANSMLEVVDNEKIKFTPEETAALVKLRSGKNNNLEAVTKLHKSTDGWIAGIILMLEQHKMGIEAAEKGGLKDYQSIFDYFSAEIFDKMDPSTQDFLLRTSFFSSMTVEMANRMTGKYPSDKILAHLLGSHYFTVKHQNNTYQYHDLFREFLISKTRKIWNHEQLEGIQQAAAKVLEDSGYVEDAAALYLQSKRWKEAVRLILKNAFDLISQGRNRSLEAWLKALPDDIVEGNPWLLYWFGACRLPFNPEESYALFKKAFKLFTKHRDRNGIFMAWTGVSDSITYGFGKLRLHDPWINIMEKLVKKWKGFPSTAIEEIAVIKMFYALNFRQQYNPRIKKWLKRAILILQNTNNPDMRVQLSTIIALYYSSIGEIRKEETVLPPLKDLKYSNQISPLAFLAFKIIEVVYNYYTAAPDPDFNAFYDGIHLAEITGIHVMDHMLISFGAAWMMSTGNIPLGRQFLQKISKTIEKTGVYDRATYYMKLTEEAMIREDFVSAYSSQSMGLQPAVESGDVNLMVMSSVQIAQVLHELSDDTKALYYLNKASRIVRKQKHFKYMYLVVKALFAFDQNNEQAGLRFLRRALQIGQDGGYVNFPGWRPSAMARLCVKALEHGINREYVRSLIKKRNLMPDTPPLACEDWPWAFKFYTLGSFKIFKDGMRVELSGKVYLRPIELLQFLIVNHERAVGLDQISSTLWPEAQGDYAHQTLDTTIHRLRKLLGSHDAVISEAGRLMLNTKKCWVDVWALEHEFNETEIILNEIKAGNGTAKKEKIKSNADAIFNLYKGPFFTQDTLAPWALHFKERLYDRFSLFIEQLGMYYEGTGEMRNAALTYQKGLEADNRVEFFYQRLMEIYKSLGRYSEAVATYKRCAVILSQTLAIEPSDKTRELYRSIITSQRQA